MRQTVMPMTYTTLPFFTRKIILERDEHTCQKCKTKLSGQKLDVHHKIPVRKGGTNSFDNLVTLCRKCHKNIEPPSSLNYAYRVNSKRKVTILIAKSTVKRLKAIGRKGDTYESILRGLLHFKKENELKKLGVNRK